MSTDTQEPVAYIVRLESGCWIAPWKGDPGRTCVRDNAQRYATPAAAKRALAQARQYRPFADARIEPAKRKPGKPSLLGTRPMTDAEAKQRSREKAKRSTASAPDTHPDAASDSGTPV